MDEKEVIRRDFFIHRKSMRQIARERHHSRKTIRQAIYDPGVPIYTRSKPRPKAAIGPFQEVIWQWLQEDQRRPVKQRHTARRVFQRLREEYCYPGSERTVRRASSAIPGDIPDSHVPQTYGWWQCTLLAQRIASKVLQRLAPTPKPKSQ